MSHRSPSQNLPTPNELSEFLQTFVPLKPKEARDVDWYWHTPSPPKLFDPAYFNKVSSPVTNFLIGVVPSEHLYDRLNAISRLCPRFRCWKPDEDAERLPPTGARGIVGFLHRPFDLERRRVARGALIHASHKSFDELLTTGWNVHLAKALGVSEEEGSSPFAMKGYKDDPDRRIGLVGSLVDPSKLRDFVTKIRQEFDNSTEVYLGDQKSIQDEEGKHRTVCTATNNMPDRDVRVIALMNASSPEVIDRIVQACVDNKTLSGSQEAGNIVILTGAPRELGLQRARELKIPVICVGHRPCEEWGIKFLAKQVRQRWPKLQVEEILDDEEVNGEHAKNSLQSGGNIPATHYKRQPQTRSQPQQHVEHSSQQDQSVNRKNQNDQRKPHEGDPAQQSSRTYADIAS